VAYVLMPQCMFVVAYAS
jgi:hypothetical protein